MADNRNKKGKNCEIGMNHENSMNSAVPAHDTDGNGGGGPLLTIGMIFKNERRCIRRCLDSLRPLREAVPCELIMADTGSTDGSRAIAAEYADQLFDFPWIDDYAAARNAVLARASGTWFFTVDCDEWLDPDIRELTDCLRGSQERLFLVVQRNYYTYDTDGPYTDFLAARLFRRTDGVHYQDPIHEYAVFHTPLADAPPALEQTILHHDGYVELTAGGGQDKRREGLALLRRELEKDPDDLRTLSEYLSIGRKEPDYRTLLERAMRLAEAKAPGWDIFGVSIFQNALATAEALGLPELEAWSDRAEAMAPDSFCLRLDGNFFRASRAADREDWQEVIRREEAYLKALGEKKDDTRWKRERTGVNLLTEHPRYVQEGRIQLARGLAHTGQAERALEILRNLRYVELEGRQAGLALLLVRDLSGAADAQAADAQELTAALSRILARTEDPTLLPATAFVHAVEHGGAYPVPGRTAAVEELDAMAEKLGTKPALLRRLALDAGKDAGKGERTHVGKEAGTDTGAESPQMVCWAASLARAAVRLCPWNGPEDMDLFRAFVRAERAFLPLRFAPAALEENGVFLLPPPDRFAWFCVRAADALDGADFPDALRLLRAALSVQKESRNMIRFLMEETSRQAEAFQRREEEERRAAVRAAAPPELRQLAEQVRTILSAYPADSPAVLALKSSPVYQRVAYLLEDA